MGEQRKQREEERIKKSHSNDRGGTILLNLILREHSIKALSQFRLLIGGSRIDWYILSRCGRAAAAGENLAIYWLLLWRFYCSLFPLFCYLIKCSSYSVASTRLASMWLDVGKNSARRTGTKGGVGPL